MMNNKISIIIPVYNVEKYLCQCVDSILNQSNKNIEIVLVDDGSTDGSSAICDEYSSKYDFIKVIHKENGGASDARNVGVSAATGDYILFVDSDDFLESDSLKRLAELVDENPVDLVFLQAQKYFSDECVVPLGDGITKEAIKGKSKEEVLSFLSRCPKFPASSCTKLIKKELFDKFDLSFIKGIVVEDVDWNLKLILSASSFDCCDEMHYNYRQHRLGSVTNQAGIRHIESLLFVMKKWVNSAEQLSHAERLFVYSSLAYEYTILVLLYRLPNRADKRKCIADIRNMLFLLNYRKGKRYSAIKILCKLFGFNFTSRLLGLYLKTRGKK